MKIITVGCGNAFSIESFNQSFVIEENGRKMLIDCGMQTPQALESIGIDFKEIDDIYISHLHADHIGGLEYFAFQRYDWMNKPRVFKNAPNLIGNVQLLKDLWDKSLRGGLESMQGFVATINTFFQTQPVEPNQSFEWQGWTVDLVQQIHIMSGSVIMPSFGIMLKKEGHKSVYFVTDSQHCSPRQMEDFYDQADIIFQDAECIGVDFSMEEGATYYQNGMEIRRDSNIDKNDAVALAEVMTEGWEKKTWGRYKFGSGVHANYAQLAGYNSANSIKLPIDIKNKMYLSHYQDFVLAGKDMYGNIVDWELQAKNDGFKGFTKVGMVLDI